MQEARTSEENVPSAWQRIRDRLGELSRLGDQARAAVDAGDGARLRDSVHRMRGVRAALARDQQRAPKLPTTPESAAFLASLGTLRRKASEAIEIADIWLRRALPDEATLRQSPEGFQTLAERLLPPVWDVDGDLVALIGPEGEAMAWGLHAFGQQRIVVYVSDGSPVGELPPQAIVVRDRCELSQVGRHLSARMPERTVTWRAHPSISREAFTELNAQIRETLAAATVDRNTVETFGELWLRQGIENLPAIASAPPLRADGQFARVPMVIVAPGPSLAKNVHLLAELRDRAVIVAFSHTLHALQAAGVVPHVVLAADMEDLRYHFEGIDIERIEALGLAYTVHPDLFSLPARRVFTFSSNRSDTWLGELLGEDAHVDNGGSVAHMAFSMGVSLGCSPIVMVGQDLSFPDGRVYCDTSVDAGTRAELAEDGDALVFEGYSDGYANMQTVGGARQSAQHRVVRVPGYHGGEVVTSTVFSMFRRWFIEQAALLRRADSDTVLLNCTEGGAHIDGMEHVSLREAIERYMTEPVDLEPGFDALAIADLDARRAHVAASLEACLGALRACTLAAKRGEALVKKVERGRRGVEVLAEAERALGEALAPVRFLSLFAHEELCALQATGRDATSLKDNLKATARLFRAVRRAAESTSPRVKRAIASLRSRERRSA